MHCILAQRQGERSLNFLVGHCSPCSGGAFWEEGRRHFHWEQLKILIWEKLLDLPKLGPGLSWRRLRGIFLWLLRESYKVTISQKPCWEFLAWEQACRKGRVHDEQEKAWLTNKHFDFQFLLSIGTAVPLSELCCNKAQLWFRGFLILSRTRWRRLWSGGGLWEAPKSHFSVTQNLNP